MTLGDGVVYGTDGRLRLSRRLWAAMVAEWRARGGVPLTDGKVRYLRRLVRRRRLKAETRASVEGAQ